MMRPLPLLFVALLATPVMADPIKLTEQGGSPALEANGASSTTISVLGGAASVTLEGSGSLNVYTHSGTVSGQGNLGVPELGLSLGGTLAADEAGAPAAPIDTENNASLDSDTCAAAHGSGAKADDLARVADENDVRIALACDNTGRLSSSMRDAIAGNVLMSGMLEARGYGAHDVRSVEIVGRAVVLFVTAAD